MIIEINNEQNFHERKKKKAKHIEHLIKDRTKPFRGDQFN